MKKVNFVIAILLSFLMIVFIGCTECDFNAITEAANIEIVKKIHVEYAKGNLDVFDEYLADNYIRHCQAMPPELWELTDKDVFKQFLGEYYSAVSDQDDHIDLIMADSDKVAYVLTMKGTHTGQMGEFPPTGKSFSLANLVIHRFENGKIAETWVSWDNIAFLGQLGLFPQPMPPAQEK